MAITYCILVLGYTCVNIPYGTLCGAMTQNIEERAKINTFRSVSAMIAIGIINIVTVPLIGRLGGGNDQKGYLLIISVKVITLLRIQLYLTRALLSICAEKIMRRQSRL